MIQGLIQDIEDEFRFKIKGYQSLSGGCIGSTYWLQSDDDQSLFLKTNSHQIETDMFIKEAHGLEELRKVDAIRIPTVIAAKPKYLLLEAINSGKPADEFWSGFGRSLAKLHKFTCDRYGFYEDNYIGSTPQVNTPQIPAHQSEAWPSFFWSHRLLPQWELAQKNGHSTPIMDQLFLKVKARLPDALKTDEPASLLHGDLWSGNFMVDESGVAGLIDPALYYGHREADLAMTRLFGGFAQEFYQAYEEAYPLASGWEQRQNIYDLYHVMNHLNLFGSSYQPQALRLLSACK